MFWTGRQNMMDMWRPGLTMSLNQRTLHKVWMLCAKIDRQTDRPTDHFLSVNGNEYDCQHHTSNCTGSWILQSVFPVGLMSTDTHKEQHMSTSVGQLQQRLTQEWWISATDCHKWWHMISPFWRHKKTIRQPKQRNSKSKAPARNMPSTVSI